jgi:hypothetical protein
LDIDTESGASDIVIRDSNGDYEIGGLNLPSLDEPEEEGCGADGREDERMLFLGHFKGTEVPSE